MYIKSHMKKRILIKYGGNAMQNESLKTSIAEKVAELSKGGIQVVVVHGGGPFINAALKEANIQSEFIGGQRYTSTEALALIERTLKGQVNTSLVSAFNRAGLKSLGLSGKDAACVQVKQRIILGKDGEKRDLGHVGDVVSVDAALPELLLAEGMIPIFACIASDAEHNDYNVNADMFAGHLAAALKVDYYVVLTDVDGLYQNYPDPESILTTITLENLEASYGKIIKGGMIPKMESCAIAIKNGARSAVVLNGTKPEQITDFLLGEKQTGTTIIKA